MRCVAARFGCVGPSAASSAHFERKTRRHIIAPDVKQKHHRDRLDIGRIVQAKVEPIQVEAVCRVAARRRVKVLPVDGPQVAHNQIQKFLVVNAARRGRARALARCEKSARDRKNSLVHLFSISG